MKKGLLKTFGIAKFLPKTGKVASMPGTVKYVGKKREAPVKLHMLDYNESDFTEKDIGKVAESLPFKESPTVTWLNITGVYDEKIIHEVGDLFKIHPLVLEDIANTTQRPKVEEYEDYIFVIIKMAYFNMEAREVILEQVSLIVGKDFVISLQEKEGNILEGLRERIRNGKGKVRKLGSDYLLYAIVDAVVDYYFMVLEKISEEIEALESKLIQAAHPQLPADIYALKQELTFLRKSIWPMREVVSVLLRAEHQLIDKSTKVFLRDVYDHTVQVVETLETFRDMASGMLDLYLSTVSNKMNEVMKVLTIFAAIFIPLTFIAGVYGMNFTFMPELKWRLGYPIWWVITITLALSMIFYFKRKRWL